MKTSNKLLLGLFCLIVATLVIFNIGLKNGMNQVLTQKNILKSHSQIIGNSLYIDSTEVILSIDKNATLADINNYKAKLKEVNIDLIIEKIKYDSRGKIELLTITVDCNDGYQGWTTKDLSRNEKIGFTRIYDNNIQLDHENYQPNNKTDKTDKKYDEYNNAVLKAPLKMYPVEFKVQHSSDKTKTYITINDESEKKVKLKTGLINNVDRICLTIGQKTTQDELEEYQTKLKSRNIDFTVKKIELDSLKQIKTIEISVDCNDGFKGTISQTLDKHKIVGFYRNYNKKSQSPFGLSPFEM